MALRVFDAGERALPNLGMIRLVDAETGEAKWIDTSSKEVRKQFAAAAKKREDIMLEVFRKTMVDVAHINTSESYIRPLSNLFARR